MDTLEYLQRAEVVEQASPLDSEPTCARCGGSGVNYLPVYGIGGEPVPGLRQPHPCPCKPPPNSPHVLEIRVRQVGPLGYETVKI